MSDIKLTKAQRIFLEGLFGAVAAPNEAHPSYSPPLALVEHNLATSARIGLARNRYTITPAGRAWLAAHPRRKK